MYMGHPMRGHPRGGHAASVFEQLHIWPMLSNLQSRSKHVSCMNTFPGTQRCPLKTGFTVNIFIYTGCMAGGEAGTAQDIQLIFYI